MVANFKYTGKIFMKISNGLLSTNLNLKIVEKT